MLKSNNNIYADLSGGTAYQKSMSMWKEMFAPNGKLDEKSCPNCVTAPIAQCSMPAALSIKNWLVFTIIYTMLEK